MERVIKEKWVPILLNEDLYEQTTIFDFIGVE